MANFSDDFNRADGLIGANWTDLAGTWEVASNAARCQSAPSQSVTVHDSGSADVDVQVTVATRGNNGGMILRGADASNYLVLVFGVSASGMVLYKRVAGTFTQIGSTATAIGASGDVVKLSGNGTAVKAYINAAELISVTETAGQINTKHGLREDSSTKCVYDDFSITDLGGGGGVTVPVLLHQYRRRRVA